MKRTTVLAVLGFVFLLLASWSSAHAQECQPYGNPTVGPSIDTFNFIANGVPDGTSACWSVNNVTIGQGTMVCGFYPQWTSNNFEFNYGGSVDQEFVIPTSRTYNYYGFVYFIDFQNPNHAYAWDLQLNMEILDRTTGTVLLTDHYDASQPDLSCVRREISGFTGSLAGHSILVHITGTRSDDASHIRVGIVQFWGSQG